VGSKKLWGESKGGRMGAVNNQGFAKRFQGCGNLGKGAMGDLSEPSKVLLTRDKGIKAKGADPENSKGAGLVLIDVLLQRLGRKIHVRGLWLLVKVRRLILIQILMLSFSAVWGLVTFRLIVLMNQYASNVKRKDTLLLIAIHQVLKS